jgi:hypothetical protein
VENNSDLKDLFIVVNDLPVELNILGGMKTEDGREWLVITDVPALEISEDEYEIFELTRNDGKVSILSIDTQSNNYEHLELYNELVELWETKVAETEDDS